jgi:hypothetical protein
VERIELELVIEFVVINAIEMVQRIAPPSAVVKFFTA